VQFVHDVISFESAYGSDFGPCDTIQQIQCLTPR